STTLVPVRAVLSSLLHVLSFFAVSVLYDCSAPPPRLLSFPSRRSSDLSRRAAATVRVTGTRSGAPSMVMVTDRPVVEEEFTDRLLRRSSARRLSARRTVPARTVRGPDRWVRRSAPEP